MRFGVWQRGNRSYRIFRVDWGIELVDLDAVLVYIYILCFGSGTDHFLNLFSKLKIKSDS